MKRKVLIFVAVLLVVLIALAVGLHFYQRNSDFGPVGKVVDSVKTLFNKQSQPEESIKESSTQKRVTEHAKREGGTKRQESSKELLEHQSEAISSHHQNKEKPASHKASRVESAHHTYEKTEQRQEASTNKLSWWQRLTGSMKSKDKAATAEQHSTSKAVNKNQHQKKLSQHSKASSHRSAPSAGVVVDLAKVTQRNVAHTINSVGVLRAKQQIVVSSEIAGKISDILFQPGAFVEKGAALFKLDDRIYQANLRAARSALVLSQSNYRRYQSIANTGAVSKQELAQAKATYEEDQAKVAANEAYLAQTTLAAPFSGYVSDASVSVGDFVNVGQSLTTLVDRQTLLAAYLVPEKYIMELSLGQTVYIEPENIAGSSQYQGKVNYISPSINEVTHSISLQAEVPNPKNELVPGSFIQVKQVVHDNKKALVIPEDAVMQVIDGNQVFLIRNGRAYRTNVELGEKSGDYLQVVKGLSLGDEVVVAGQQNLTSGDLIRRAGGS